MVGAHLDRLERAGAIVDCSCCWSGHDIALGTGSRHHKASHTDPGSQTQDTHNQPDFGHRPPIERVNKRAASRPLSRCGFECRTLVETLTKMGIGNHWSEVKL